jgi:nucleoside-diphosphate-sugar epimerase
MTMALVTGAGGWLGSRLVKALVDGLPEYSLPADYAPLRPVRALVMPEATTEFLKDLAGPVEVVRGDVTRLESLPALFAGAAGGTVFHCAGLIHPALFTRDFFTVNVKGTENVLNAARASGVRRVVYVSSNSPFGTNPTSSDRFDEDAPYAPYQGYGESKRQAELLVKKAHSGNLSTVIVRCPWFYGPHQPPRQSLFFQMIASGKVPIVGDGECRRSMSYVDNLCHGLLLADGVEAAGGRAYWIADRRPYSMNEIVDTVERVLERDFKVKVAHRRMRLPHGVGEIAGWVDTVMQTVGLYHQKIHVLSEMNKTIACTVEKAVRELGYQPQVELEEGMRRSIKWLVDRGFRF